MKLAELGDLSVSKVVEMQSDMPIRFGFPDLQHEDLERLATWYRSGELTCDPGTSSIRISLHSYVLRSGGVNILIDACTGNHKRGSVPVFEKLETPYLERLAAVGLTSADIGLVLCTHLHCDYVGWNTRLENGSWVPTFPNARYLFTRLDFAFYQTQLHEQLHCEAFDDSVMPIVSAGLAEIVEADHIVQHVVGDGVGCRQHTAIRPALSWCTRGAAGARRCLPATPFTTQYSLCAHRCIFRRRRPRAGGGDTSTPDRSQCRYRCDHLSCPFPGTSAGTVRRDGAAYRFVFLQQD